jgi:hypothetical protein
MPVFAFQHWDYSLEGRMRRNRRRAGRDVHFISRLMKKVHQLTASGSRDRGDIAQGMADAGLQIEED